MTFSLQITLNVVTGREGTRIFMYSSLYNYQLAFFQGKDFLI